MYALTQHAFPPLLTALLTAGSYLLAVELTGRSSAGALFDCIRGKAVALQGWIYAEMKK